MIGSQHKQVVVSIIFIFLDESTANGIVAFARPGRVVIQTICRFCFPYTGIINNRLFTSFCFPYNNDNKLFIIYHP